MQKVEVTVLTKDELRSIIREEFIDLVSKSDVTPQKRFNVKEAAEYIGMPVPSFRQHQHKFGGIKIGKQWSFTKKELDQGLEKLRRKTIAEITATI